MRRFLAITLSMFIAGGIFLGCHAQNATKDGNPIAKADPAKNDPNKGDKGDKGDGKVPVPVVKLDNPKQNGDPKVDPVKPASDEKQEKYEAALTDALTALAERRWQDALTAFEAARAVDDTEFVNSEILKLKSRLEQDGTAKTTVKNIETVLNDGKAEDAVKLADEALKEFGDGDEANKIVLLRLQADALVSVQKKEGAAARFDRFSQEAKTARKENNLRAEVLALELALQAKDDADLKQDYADAVARIEKYDALRKRAGELRIDSTQLEDALASLQDAKTAWDTAQVRSEIDEVTLAMQKRREAISVADFEVRNDVGMADAGAAMAEELLPRFKAKYDLVERAQLNRVIGELKLQQGFLDEAKAQDNFSKLAKVRYLVLGSISRRTNISIRARLVDLRTGLIVQTAGIVAPTMEKALEQAPDLAKQLMMTDEEKMQFEAAQVDAKPIPVVGDKDEVGAAPLPPQGEELPPPAPNLNAPPPAFGEMNRDNFRVLAPPPADFVAPAPEPLVVQQRRRLLFASIEMGDWLFRAGRFRDAQRQFEFALALDPSNFDLQIRLERVRPLVPGIVIVDVQPVFVRPRLAVLPFHVGGALPRSLGYWTPSHLAPYFASRYEIVDPGEIYWYMGRMGLTIHDLLRDANARRWLGRAVGVRYIVLGTIFPTTSFDVNTYLLDTEFGFLQGGASINVRDPFELKLRLSELAQLTMMTPAERDAFLAQQQFRRFTVLVADGRLNMDARRYRKARDEFALALQIFPNNVQVQLWYQICADGARFEDFVEAQRLAAAQRQAALEAARRRQLQLAQEAEFARRNAIAISLRRTDAERRTHVLFRFQARDNMVTQAQFALQTKRFGISINLFQGAMDVGAITPPPGIVVPPPIPPTVIQDFANARLQAELREAQARAAREAAIRQERERQLALAKKKLEDERLAAQTRLDAERAASAKRDDDAFKAGIAQGQRFIAQSKFEAALAALQGAQRVARTNKQREDVNKYIEIIVQRQAEANAKNDTERKAIEARLDAERARRKLAEEKYKVALLAAQTALAAKNLELAQAKFEEAKLLYQTDAVRTGLQQVQSAKAAALADRQRADAAALKDDAVKALIVSGNAALDAQKFGDAVKIFQEAKKLSPDNLAVMTGLTKAEQARDRLLAAQRRQAEELARTQGFTRLVESGRANLAAKQFEAAVANLTEAVRLNPTDAAVQLDLKRAIAGRDAALKDANAQAAAKLRADQYQKLMTDGQAALDSKRFGDAIKAFTAAQTLLPGDLASKNLIQEAQTAKKATDDAVALAAKQRADTLRKAKEVEKLLTSGRLALAAKDFAKAKKLFEDAKAINPTDAEVARGLRDVAQAEASAVAAAAAQKQRAAQFETALSSGRDALNAKKYTEALKALSQATTLMPENKEAQDLFRRAQVEAKQAADAAAAAKTRTANYQLALSVGQKALNAKQFGDAIKSFQNALDLMPNDAEASRLLKLARDGQTAAVRSAEDFQKAMTAGQAAMAKGNYADAVKQFTTAKNLSPMDASALKSLAQAQKALSDVNQAAVVMANFQKAMTAGQNAMTAKNYGLAVASFKDALKWMPNDQNARTQLQAAERALADSQKTKPMPDPGQAFNDAMAKATAAEKDKRYSDAVKAYQDALKLRQNDAKAQAGLKQNQYAVHLVQGQQYLNSSMWMAAQTEFEAALKLFPNADQAKQLLKKAKSKMK